ncbi:MAG: hypothetical protein H7Y42_06060 [Chitinophagaceae bacterium]|nr:hypothetical protein [Chitinophagaceae bacterium]
MWKLILCFLGLTLLQLNGIAQTPVSYVTTTASNTPPTVAVMLQEERDRFVRELKDLSNDPTVIDPLTNHFSLEVNKIQASLMSNTSLNEIEREKATRSLIYFIKELTANIRERSTDMYDLPGAIQSFKSILASLIAHKPFTHALVPIEPRRLEMLAGAFSQYKEFPLLEDMTVYKRMSASPAYILQFLESRPGFRYADSLLVAAAANDPIKVVYYLNREKPGIQEKIRSSDNLYVQQIVSLSKGKNAAEVLPFIIQLAENKITPQEILEKRLDVNEYFRLLVNSLKVARESKDSASIFLGALRNGIKDKALAFYANQINDLHNATDAVRFASVKNLRPEDLYYVITSCGEELFTSSYLGLYKRLMENFKDQPADALFELVRYDNFRTFMRLAANYNVLGDFLRNTDKDGKMAILKRFIAGIENDINSGVDRAMDIADVFASLDSTSDVNGLISAELRSNLIRCTSNKQFLGMRLYTILLQVLDLVNREDSKVWAKLGNYDVLERKSLENEKGEIVQLMLFYGDEDGVASFNNFLKSYSNDKKWEVTKNESWVSVRSVSEKPVIIFANLPLDIKEELDIKAQDKLIAYLSQQSLEPTVFIHRGHSYHLEKTLKRLKPSVKLAILGSCGGYNKAISIASINPDVQVIGSKKTGAKSINDPIIEAINETLINNNNISWTEIWNKLGTRFSKDEAALNLFGEYFSPSKNLSLFVLKLFMFNNRFV